MLSAMLWYTRNGLVVVTDWPFWYSCASCGSLSAGPMPLIPNRLWSLVARPLRPQPDWSMAWAIVTDAGTPYFCCMAMAPGTISAMNARCALVWETDVRPGGGGCLRYRAREDDVLLAAPGVVGSPGIAAEPGGR